MTRTPTPSERNLPALRRVCDEFLSTGEPVRDHGLNQEFGSRSIYELRLLGLLSHHHSRIVPSRNGLRRIGRVDALSAPARLYRALQDAWAKDRSHTQWLLERVAKLIGADERTARISMLLLDGAPSIQVAWAGALVPVVYVSEQPGLSSVDAKPLEGVQAEPCAARSAEALRLRYEEGERCFPLVEADRGALAGAVLDGVQIQCGSIRGADLRGASLRGAQLGAFPVRRDLPVHGLSLVESDLARADLTGADLRGADLRDASLEGARFDEHSSIPLDALTSASWTTVYHRDAPRGRGEAWPETTARHEVGFRMVRDASADAWTVYHRGSRLSSVHDSLGVQITALLLANPNRVIHALDLDAALLDNLPLARSLGELPYDTTDVVRLLAERGLPTARHLSDDELARLRACLRACDRLAGSEAGKCLHRDLAAALTKRELKLGAIAHAKKTTDRLRNAFARARDGVLAADALLPLVRGVHVGEFSRYHPSEGA